MNIGFIGAGRVGCTIGRYLADAGISIEGYYSRSKESADVAATFTNTRSFESIEELVISCDTIFLTTSDSAIENVWNCIDRYDLKDKVISHFSGSLSSDIFSGIEKTGAYGCSIHPMYAFSDKFTSYRQFNTACLTMEGHSEAINKMKSLFGDKLGHRIYTLDPKDKIKYHAAAAFASNYVDAVMQIAVDLMGQCGFSEEDTFTLLGPLVKNNVNSIVDNGTVASLTGPAERNDVGTVKKHLQAIEGTDAEEVYRVLGRTLLSIAEKKNPDTDYTAMKKIIYIGH